MELLIAAEGLAKRYPGQRREDPALIDLGLAVPAGHLFGLVGPDGAGKTTAIRILATVMPASAGTARVAGYDIRRQAEKVRPRIGYMPQSFSLYPDLTVLENLTFFSNIHGVPAERRRRRIPELLAFARLEQFRDRRAADLSGGMRKKLALACALVHEPRVLLLDEPTTGVDPVSRRELWRILAEVVQQGVAVLVSTPYMDEAERCHQVGILYDGRLLVSGAPAELEAGLPYQVLELQAEPRRAMRQAATEVPGIAAWRPVGDRLRLVVTDLESVVETLRAALFRAGAQVQMLRPSRVTMEDVFIHLVEARRAAGPGGER